jgi:hypothetical protein
MYMHLSYGKNITTPKSTHNMAKFKEFFYKCITISMYMHLCSCRNEAAPKLACEKIGKQNLKMLQMQID